MIPFDPWDLALRKAGKNPKRLETLSMAAIRQIKDLLGYWKEEGMEPPALNPPPTWSDEDEVPRQMHLQLENFSGSLTISAE
ncbi:MAG: hypothetical protein LBV12_06475 [Puniceicoccales bacterium]|jgi:hypothetical protein|nr:hypothetical protein [Puniceicoccales bacterium]